MRVRKLLALVLLVLTGAAALAPVSAFAHAYQTGSAPFRDEVFKDGQPERVVFKFNEPVEASFGAVRVFDTQARRVDRGEILRPGGDTRKLAVQLDKRLPDGSYTATYRIVSSDGHVINGGFVFHIGTPSTGGALAVGDLVASSQAGAATSTALSAVRALDYFALALALGGLAFLFLCWQPGLRAAAREDEGWTHAREAYSRRAGKLLLGAVNLGIASAVLGILIQGAIVSGETFWSALQAATVRDVLGTRFGTVWGIKLIVWLALGAALMIGRLGADGSMRGAQRVGALALLSAALALFPAFSGHASTQDPVAVLFPLDVAHVVAMSLWLGGLVALVALVPAATAALEPGDRSRLLAEVLRRFSPIALGAVLILAVTGTVQAVMHLTSLGQLTSTGFGRAILIKIGLLLALSGLGARNRQRTLPELKLIADTGGSPGEVGGVLKRTLRAEVALIVAVLATTGALVGYAPPASLQGPAVVNVERRLGPLDLNMTVEPATVGANTMHVYLFDDETGAPFEGTKSITAQATLEKANVGPLEIALRKSGPGHFTADSFALTLTGEWTIRIVERVSEFDQYATTITVPIR